MVRTQIQLTESQARRVRSLAREEGISMAEFIRRCVDRALEQHAPDREALYERAAGAVGRFKDREKADDVAEEHDRYLEDAFR